MAKRISKWFLYKIGSHLSDVDEGALTKFGMKFRLFFARKISKNISKKASIHRGARITGDGKNLVIEEHGCLGINCSCGSNTYIGSNTMIGPDVTILNANHVFSTNEKKFVGSVEKPVHIGKNCWIGKSAIILPGAYIGDGCIIGAGAVVPGKTYPDYSLIAGNPAEVKKKII